MNSSGRDLFEMQQDHQTRHKVNDPDPRKLELFVPGRLCLFGEHSDWAGGYRRLDPKIHKGCTIVVGTEQGLAARASSLQERVLEMSSCDIAGTVRIITLPLDSAALLEEARNGGFWSYVAGVAYWMLLEHEVSGICIENYSTTLPMSKGLSSSAAVCVLVARAFNEICGLKLTIRGVMEVAYRGEILTPSHCGRMDQACAFGSVPVSLTFDGDVVHVDTVQLATSLFILIVDLRASKDTVTILSALQSAYGHDAPSEEQTQLYNLFGEGNQGMCERALRCMQNGDVQGLGAAMSAAQAAFDSVAVPFCEAQLAAPKLHAVLSCDAIQQFIWGGKGVGSQGDGTAQLLCRSGEAMAKVQAVLETQHSVVCLPMVLKSTS